MIQFSYIGEKIAWFGKSFVFPGVLFDNDKRFRFTLLLFQWSGCAMKLRRNLNRFSFEKLISKIIRESDLQMKKSNLKFFYTIFLFVFPTIICITFKNRIEQGTPQGKKLTWKNNFQYISFLTRVLILNLLFNICTANLQFKMSLQESNTLQEKYNYFW